MKTAVIFALLGLASCGGNSGGSTGSVGASESTDPGGPYDGGYTACSAPQGVSTTQTNDGCYWLPSYTSCVNGACSQLCPSTQYPMYCRSPNESITSPIPAASLGCATPGGQNSFGSGNEFAYCCPCQ